MITILFLASNPHDTSRLAIDEELRAIDQKLRLTKFRDVFDIKSHWAVRTSDLQELLLRHKPNIVHFSGHGSALSEIILQDNFGANCPVSPQALSNLFSILRSEIRCVVLSVCFSHKQAEAIAKRVDCVVGMTSGISDQAAIIFASAFYQALGYGQSIKTAFDLGCSEIQIEQLGEHETPVLLSPNVDPNTITFQPTQVQSVLQDTKISPDQKLSNKINQFPKPKLTSFIYCIRCGGTLGKSTKCPNYYEHKFVEIQPDSRFIYCSRCGAVPGEVTTCPNYYEHKFVEANEPKAPLS